MCILIIQGPHRAAPDRRAETVGGETLDALAQRALAAGKAVVVRGIASVREMIDCLRQADNAEMPAEIVLLDPGDLPAMEDAQSASGLRNALNALHAPYIEVHEGSGTALEPRLSPRNGPMATVIINRNLGESYRLALGIALRRLGCVRDDASR